MGVKGLQYYTEQHCPNVCKPVSLKEMVTGFKRTHHLEMESAIIVVDGMSLINKLYAGKIEWVYGGRWQLFLDMWKDFVECFTRIGIRLVFFFDGSIVPLKRHEWISRRLRQMVEMQVIFQWLKKSFVEPKDFKLPVGMATLSIFAIKSLNVDVFTSVKEADTEVAEFARYNPAVMAILAQDSDYFIYDTKDYISVKHLDLDNMTTVLYDRKALAGQLKLEVRELPLLSCLLGNDVVPHDMVKPFHRNICSKLGVRGIPQEILIPHLSSIMKQRRWRGDPSNIEELKDISQIIFRHVGNHGLFANGIKWYAMSLAPPPITSTDLVEQRHILCENFPTIYNAMHNLEYGASEVLEDCDDARFPSTALMYQFVRQRAYYVLLGGQTNITIKEWLAFAQNLKLKMLMPIEVKPVPINILGLPSTIKILWNETAHEVKFQCFIECLGLSIGSQQLSKISNKYAVLCCILNYMLVRNPKMLEFWEVLAFVVQAIRLEIMTLDDLRNLPTELVNTQAVHLSTLFMAGVTTVGMLLGICGYPYSLEECLPWNFFDGKLFHNIYIIAKATSVAELCTNKTELEEVYKLLNVITFGTTLENKLHGLPSI